MSGTELALRITFAVIAALCLITGLVLEGNDKLGCLGVVALVIVGGSCFVGALAGPDAAAHWVGVQP